MKFGELKSIGHNIAHSLASGVGLMIGFYATDVFGEAERSAEGYILVDLMAGTSSGGQPSASLAKAITFYAKAVEELCQRHGTGSDAFQELKIRYSSDATGVRFVVTVTDQNGRRSIDEYHGWAGKRLMVRGADGRVRPKRNHISWDAE